MLLTLFLNLKKMDNLHVLFQLFIGTLQMEYNEEANRLLAALSAAIDPTEQTRLRVELQVLRDRMREDRERIERENRNLEAALDRIRRRQDSN